jgi:Double-GTPase 1
MSASDTFTTLVLGLPEAGKTTFLAAFWHAIAAPGDEVSLKLARLHPLREYLNTISEAWLRCEPVPRTTMATEQTVTLELRTSEEPETFASLAFPDHAGEKFVEQWAHREWSGDYADLVRRTDGVVVFINPARHIPDPTIPQTMRLAAQIGIDGDDAAENITAWEPRMAPPDVQLVDLLQCVLWHRQVSSIPVAVVISAWDLVEPTKLSPRDWLTRYSPLLFQFLVASIGAYEVFGVSAQGGDLANDSERLLDTTEPLSKVRVITPLGTSHDITQPIRWLIEQRDGDG